MVCFYNVTGLFLILSRHQRSPGQTLNLSGGNMLSECWAVHHFQSRAKLTNVQGPNTISIMYPVLPRNINSTRGQRRPAQPHTALPAPVRAARLAPGAGGFPAGPPPTHCCSTSLHWHGAPLPQYHPEDPRPSPPWLLTTQAACAACLATSRPLRPHPPGLRCLLRGHLTREALPATCLLPPQRSRHYFLSRLLCTT